MALSQLGLLSRKLCLSANSKVGSSLFGYLAYICIRPWMSKKLIFSCMLTYITLTKYHLLYICISKYFERIVPEWINYCNHQNTQNALHHHMRWAHTLKEITRFFGWMNARSLNLRKYFTKFDKINPGIKEGDKTSLLVTVVNYNLFTCYFIIKKMEIDRNNYHKIRPS